MIYKTADRASNRLVSLIIKAVPPSKTSEFEETFIEALGLSRARALLGGNIDTMMAYEASADNAESAPQARILDRIGDLDISQKDIESVTLSANKKSYTRSSIQTIQLFHYKTLEKNVLIHKPSFHRQGLLHCDNAEIVMSYEPADPDSDDADITRTILYLKHNTRSTVSSEDSRVKLHAIECTSIASNGEDQPVMRNVDVSLQFSTKEACTRFQAKIEEMRLELFVVSLQTPQPQEKLALKL
ncbi:hypothetical protein QQZ08_011448 [Neonectria magnoliae]|uniref:Uncharacterized protein n=1 Tax=Neonectria magnoliae TaxID=2732573 RepID=A0ABR1H9V0_9HYPO